MDFNKNNCCDLFVDHITQFDEQSINFFKRLRPLLPMFGNGMSYVDDAINQTLRLFSIQSDGFESFSALKDMVQKREILLEVNRNKQ